MSDSEDETQDWRSLDARVLKRGEKDHAPDGTIVQQTTLQQSRDAMYSALSKPASSQAKNIVECDWDSQRARGIVRKVKGNYFTTIGWAESVTTYAYPEEIIYLVQRGSMICYFEEKPLTIEGTMALLLAHVSFEKMQVYSHLKRLGYVVRRGPEPAGVSDCSNKWSPLPSIDGRSLVWLIFGAHLSKLAWKPFYSTYGSVYKDLQWVSAKPIKSASVNTQTRDANSAAVRNFDYYIWKPATKFKRSSPPPPDFKIRVVSADDPLPLLNEMEYDFEKNDYIASTKNSVVTRMREGCRHFIYAVVDNGVVSFVRAAEPEVEFIPQ